MPIPLNGYACDLGGISPQESMARLLGVLSRFGMSHADRVLVLAYMLAGVQKGNISRWPALVICGRMATGKTLLARHVATCLVSRSGHALALTSRRPSWDKINEAACVAGYVLAEDVPLESNAWRRCILDSLFYAPVLATARSEGGAFQGEFAVSVYLERVPEFPMVDPCSLHAQAAMAIWRAYIGVGAPYAAKEKKATQAGSLEGWYTSMHCACWALENLT